MSDTNIEWTDKVWNPVTGCTKVLLSKNPPRLSEGCRNCYAYRMANRLKGRCGYPANDPFKITLRPDRLDEPLGWKKPKRIFVCSMGDLFHEDVPFEFIEKVFSVIYDLPHHIFMILTKRPERMKLFFESPGVRWPVSFLSTVRSFPYNNLYLGVSVEDQATADERIPLLLQTPAAKRFVSYEPALGPVIIEPFLEGTCLACYGTGECEMELGCPHCSMGEGPKLDQIIMGGETGPGARPLHPDWARSVRDQCAEAGVPFFFKQWGECAPEDQSEEACFVSGGCSAGDESCLKKIAPVNSIADGDGTTEVLTYRVGKKKAGHLLDGKEHRELI